MILLDLFSEAIPQYSRFESFYGHYYIWNMLHDFGGNNILFGSLVNITNVNFLFHLIKQNDDIKPRDHKLLVNSPVIKCLVSVLQWKVSIKTRSCMNSLWNNHGEVHSMTQDSVIGNYHSFF